MNLPPTSLRQIFINLDGGSLVRCQRVCSYWYHEAKLYESSSEFWRNKCVEEIKSEFMLNIIEKLFPSFISNNEIDISWKAVYISWYRWKLLKKWPLQLREMEIPCTGEIVCAKFCGNWLVYGTRNSGTLIAVDMNSPENVRGLFKGCSLQDFVFLPKGNFKDYLDRQVLIKTERALHLFHLQRRLPVKNLQSVSPVAWLLTVNEFAAQKLKAINPKFENNKSLVLPKMIIGFDCSAKISRRDGSVKYKSFSTDPNWIYLNHNVAVGISSVNGHMVTFVVGEEFKVYRPRPEFGTITTVLLHANNFFIATSNGKLYHYSIDKLEDFLEFDFSEFDWFTKVHEICDDNKILSIDVCECELYNRPYIALAVSSCKIIVIDFTTNLKS